MKSAPRKVLLGGIALATVEAMVRKPEPKEQKKVSFGGVTFESITIYGDDDLFYDAPATSLDWASSTASKDDQQEMASVAATSDIGSDSNAGDETRDFEDVFNIEAHEASDLGRWLTSADIRKRKGSVASCRGGQVALGMANSFLWQRRAAPSSAAPSC